MTLKDDIKLIRDAMAGGDIFNTMHNNYGAYRAVCDAAEKTLPKTKKAWAIECDIPDKDGRVDRYRHGSVKAWPPYDKRIEAVLFAQILLESNGPIYSNVSVKEIEVEDK